MTSIERTAYPRFKRHFTSKELTEIYTPTRAEIAFAYSTTKGQSNIFNLLLALKAFQRLGYFSKFSDLPHPIINHLRTRVLDASEIKEFNLPKRITLILCLIYSAQVTTRDNLVEMFMKKIKSIHHNAKKELELIQQKHQETVDKVVGVFIDVLQIFISKPAENELVQQVDRVLLPSGGAEQLLTECEMMNAYKGNNYLPLLWQFFKSHRSTFFRLIGQLQFESTTSEQSVIEALNFIKENQDKRGEFLKTSISLDFASSQWRKLVLIKQGEDNKVVRRHLEVCVFSYLMAELRSGDICVVGSDSYADYREQLLKESEYSPLIDQYCADLGFADNPADFIKQLQSLLTETAAAVDAGYPDNDQLVIDDSGEPLLKKYPRRDLSPSVAVLLDAVEKRFPERNLIDILRNVDYWTNFTRHFGPMSGSDPKIDRATERYILTSFTYGCNLGPTQAAKHMRGMVSAKELSFVNRRHVAVDKLNAALVDIINRYNVLKLPGVWGDGTTAAADGTKYELYEENLLSEYHIRYGGYGGIAYHHVSDTYVALFSHFISCGTWEAVYIIEGLLKNCSDIQPDTIHADTQGQSTPVFALSYMLGIKLMPRIRNWKDVNFYRPDKDTAYQHIDSLFSEAIDWSKIQSHWQDILQVVLSIKMGKVSSAVLLRKLGNYSRKNRLYQAFQELGRVIRTVFLLQYISDLKLRRQITAATNIVESYNGFSKWFFFGGAGIIANNDPVEQEKIIKYNDLIANAVIFHNVVDLTDILRDLKKAGFAVNREDVAALSPYMTSHVKRFGDYLIDMETVPNILDDAEALVWT